MMEKFAVTALDREIWETELESFVPARVFDAHTHIWSEKFARPETQDSPLRVEADAGTLRDHYAEIFPGRTLNYLMLGTPVEQIDFAGYRQWCVEEANRFEGDFPAVLVTPDELPDHLAADAEKFHFPALKPYLSYAPLRYQSPISGFMPERLIEVADHYHLVIVLHVSKPLCFADPENLRDLEYFTKKYPHVTWQLAHCARSFNGSLLESSIGKLKYLDHLCYDLSAVCDPYAMYLLFKNEEHKRLLYGSDNVCGGAVRGTYAPFGRSWALCPPAPTEACTTICYEQLRAMKKAAIMAEIDAVELREIFCDNAVRIYHRR